MTAHRLLDPGFEARRGKGLDRRPIIVIDGRNYKPGPGEAAELARRMTAKQIAADWFWCLMELAVIVGICGMVAVWAIMLDTGGIVGG